MRKILILSLSLLSSVLADYDIPVYEVTEIKRPVENYNRPQYRPQPQQRCYTKDVPVQVPCGEDTNALGLDTLIGAALGVAVGNQIGKGNGRDVAKIAGGVIGAGVANNQRNQGCTAYKSVTTCEPIYDERADYNRYNRVQEEVVVGYNNCGYYDGVRYCVQSKYPRKFLRVDTRTGSVY